jgi:[glutamine synthetase] adenylyltransferase / [glutamine synthetase]-adenylyl-L-tyrosine phosphorylase
MSAPGPTPSEASTTAASAAHSRFVQRVRRRYADELALLPAGLPAAAEVTALVHALHSAGRDVASALRVARHVVMERLAVLDIEQGAAMDDITASVSALAEATLEIALAQAHQEADARHGLPLNAQGQRVDFWIVGMGKLGARELNVSSDIDLIYVYEEDGHTRCGDATQRGVSLHEYFGFVARRLFALIGDTTDDGFVFRVDLALRPNGKSGPPVVSLAMLEEYFQVQGREWERFAWLKSRVVAPRAAVTSGRARALAGLVTPFVYRRYLDYGVFESLRQLHHKVREEAKARAAGRPERANDVKLSRGGIREIEFTVQLLLVVRGGQFPEIRTRSTLRGLQRLVDRGLMAADTAQKLAAGYVFLRRVEHRIQFLDDQQTHLLPNNDEDLLWMAHSLGFICKKVPGKPLASALLDHLGEVRETVAAEFDALLRDGEGGAADGSAGKNGKHGAGNGPPDANNGCRICGPGGVPKHLSVESQALLDTIPPALAERLRHWAQQPRVLALRDETRLRLGRLMQKTAQALSEGRCSEAGALRFVDWLEPLLRRENYLALLVERPEVLSRLLRLLGLARWPMQYLMRHPGVIDELADARLLNQRFDAAAFDRELEARLQSLQRAQEDDEEKLLDILRRAHHAEVFRTLVRDVEGELTVEQVADDLSVLADTLVGITVRWAWPRLKQRHCAEPHLAVIAYGKLGGKELGYGSDLDVVFLYDDGVEPDEVAKQRAQEVYAAFVRKLITWFTLRTAAGELFDIDTALRPNGSSGLLVTSIEAFERYQVGRGGNTAWTWEHQALSRARFVCGAPSVAARFEATRRAVLTTPRDVAALREEVRSMLEKVRAAHPVAADKFDVKHSPGGMMDVEFVVQFLVLSQSAAHAGLQDNVGNIALLQRAEAVGLLPAGVGTAAADAYRELRRAQHQARLDEQPTQVDPALLAGARGAVLVLWRVVFA